MRELRVGRWFAAAAGGLTATLLSLTLLFGNPFMERVLFTSSNGQSEKFLDVWFSLEPLPALVPFWDSQGAIGAPALAVLALLFVWSLAITLLYVSGWAKWAGSVWRKGAILGLVVWATLFIFLEAWIPLNLLGEPFSLVTIELVLELIAMVIAGVTIAVIYEGWPRRSTDRAV